MAKFYRKQQRNEGILSGIMSLFAGAPQHRPHRRLRRVRNDAPPKYNPLKFTPGAEPAKAIAVELSLAVPMQGRIDGLTMMEPLHIDTPSSSKAVILDMIEGLEERLSFKDKMQRCISENDVIVSETSQKFKPEKILAEGGMGACYLGRMYRLDGVSVDKQPLAVMKVASPPKGASNKALEFILNALHAEATAVSSVDSKYVAAIRNVLLHRETGALGVVYEYIDGWEGDALYKKFEGNAQRLPVDLLMLTAERYLTGLVDIHSAGHAHRDQCARNFMIKRSDGRPMILDLGLVLSGSPDDQHIVHDLQGKPSNMSPDFIDAVYAQNPLTMEQLQKIDVWQASAMFYRLLTGTDPYPDRSGNKTNCLAYCIEKAKTAATRTLLMPHEICPDIPYKVSRIIHQGLNPDWKARPAAKEMRTGIQRSLYDGLIPNGMRDETTQRFLEKLVPGAYKGAELGVDVRNSDYVALLPLVLASYRQRAYALHEKKHGPLAWESTVVPAKPKVSYTPIEHTKELLLEQDPTAYAVRRAVRFTRNSIGPTIVATLRELYNSGLESKEGDALLTKPEYAPYRSFLEQQVATLDNPDWRVGYGALHKAVMDALPSTLAALGKRVPPTPAGLSNYADVRLAQHAYELMNIHPEARTSDSWGDEHRELL